MVKSSFSNNFPYHKMDFLTNGDSSPNHKGEESPSLYD